jgi:hypothetical protein
MIDQQIYVSLTTIPSRFNKISQCIDSLLHQSIIPKKIIINIPFFYSLRFKQSISKKDIDLLEYEYSGKVIINMVDTDYGPGTKLLGLLKNNMIKNKKDFIILVDDDVIYDKYFIEGLFPFAQPYYVSSYFTYNYENLNIGQGVDGIMIYNELLLYFLQYYEQIKSNEIIHFHDDIYISFYFKLLNINITRVNDNKTIYINYNNSDSLSTLTNNLDRSVLTDKIIVYLNELNQHNKFDFINSEVFYESI